MRDNLYKILSLQFNISLFYFFSNGTQPLPVSSPDISWEKDETQTQDRRLHVGSRERSVIVLANSLEYPVEDPERIRVDSVVETSVCSLFDCLQIF